MKLLIIGLFPVLIFWAAEEYYGTTWGLIAAVIWAIGECLYEWIRFRKIEKLTLISTGLVVGLGALSAWLENGVLFKFQPAIIELVFAGLLFFGGRGGEPVLLKMAKKTRPDLYEDQRPEILEFHKNTMKRMTYSLLAVLVLHAGLMAYIAVNGTTGQWAFWKGIGFNIFLGIWMALEILNARLRRKTK